MTIRPAPGTRRIGLTVGPFRPLAGIYRFDLSTGQTIRVPIDLRDRGDRLFRSFVGFIAPCPIRWIRFSVEQTQIETPAVIVHAIRAPRRPQPCTCVDGGPSSGSDSEDTDCAVGEEAPRAIVVGKDQRAGNAEQNHLAAIVLEGCEGHAQARFHSVAACLEGGRAGVSKSGVAAVINGEGGTIEHPSARVGDGAVAACILDGATYCVQQAAGVVVRGGHVGVHGRGSVGVLLDPAAHSTGQLPGNEVLARQSLILFAVRGTPDGPVRWVLGCTGTAADTVTIQEHLEPGKPYRLEDGKLVRAD